MRGAAQKKKSLSPPHSQALVVDMAQQVQGIRPALFKNGGVGALRAGNKRGALENPSRGEEGTLKADEMRPLPLAPPHPAT